VRACSLEHGHAVVTHESGANADVKVHPILDNLAFGNALEEQSRAIASLSGLEPPVPNKHRFLARGARCERPDTRCIGDISHIALIGVD
jgi:hypothetical protein